MKSLSSHPFCNHFFLANDTEKDLKLLVPRYNRDLRAVSVLLWLVPNKEVEISGVEVASECLESKKWPNQILGYILPCRPGCPGWWHKPFCACFFLHVSDRVTPRSYKHITGSLFR